MKDLLSDLWLRLGSVEKRRAGDVKNGTIVRYQGEWGVKESNRLDRWIGGQILLPREAIVEVMPPKDLKKLAGRSFRPGG